MLHLSSLFQESANPSEAGILLVIGRIRRGVRSDPLAVRLAAAVQRAAPTWHPTIPHLMKNSLSPSRKKHRYGYLTSIFCLIKPNNKFLITHQRACCSLVFESLQEIGHFFIDISSHMCLVMTLHFNSLAYKWAASEKKFFFSSSICLKVISRMTGWQKV